MTSEALQAEFVEAFDLEEPPAIDLGDAGRAGAGPVVVTLAHDEALRLPHFLDHHRALGVRHFLVVENVSTDATAALLDAAPDVTRLPSSRPYRDFARIWRRLVADLYCEGRWVLFPDVDELFVHPAWPNAPLSVALSHWEEQGSEAVFAPLVDMYPDGPLAALSYTPGTSMLEACPMFDCDSYRFKMRREEEAERLSPPYLLRGGARERLFFTDRGRLWRIHDRLIMRTLFSPKRRIGASRWRRRIDDHFWDRFTNALLSSPPNVGKIPLVRWRRGLTFSRGPHRITPRIALAEDWGTLLHFKFLDDFVVKTKAAVERRQHHDGAAEYRRYDARARRILERGMCYAGSRRLTRVEDLIGCGLMRRTRGLEEACRVAPPKVD